VAAAEEVVVGLAAEAGSALAGLDLVAGLGAVDWEALAAAAQEAAERAVREVEGWEAAATGAAGVEVSVAMGLAAEGWVASEKAAAV
jgi:hypothetical protein